MASTRIASAAFLSAVRVLCVITKALEKSRRWTDFFQKKIWVHVGVFWLPAKREGKKTHNVLGGRLLTSNTSEQKPRGRRNNPGGQRNENTESLDVLYRLISSTLRIHSSAVTWQIGLPTRVHQAGSESRVWTRDGRGEPCKSESCVSLH